MIRKLLNGDIDRVADIWLKTNLKTHYFISNQYWKSNYELVKEMLSQSEVYVFEADKMIQGFVGLNDEYIEGIFVSDEMQSCGIGKLLLDYIKDKKVSLRLNVYQKNARAISFYQREGFIIQCKGENVYIDSLTYEQFMMLGDAELSRRFSMQDEAEQKAKIDREQANELEYVDESQKSDAAESANASNGSAGGKPVRNPEREKPKWEDTITNRMLHWSYTPEQKEEVKKALAAGVPKATILTYFYPEVTVEKMSSYRKKQ